jgi:hypothetical protein
MHEYDSSAFPREMEYEYSPRQGVFNEAQEVQLAEQMLELENEQELEQFLGDLIKKAGSAIGGLVKGPVGQALGGALKSVAGQVLPMAGQAIGGIFGPAGAQIGGQLASAAGSAFGLGEMEAGEQEFEAAQTFVRLAADAVKNAAQAPPGANPHAVAQAAVAQAAQAHAPGLLSGVPSPGPGGMGAPGGMGQGFGQSGGFGFGSPGGGPGGMGPGGPGAGGRTGQWARHGNKIVVYGV